jgi:hypothetical protein
MVKYNTVQQRDNNSVLQDKGKGHPITCHEGTEREKCTALHYLKQRRYKGWVVNATPRPLYSREWPGIYFIGGWRGSQGWSGRVRKILSPPGFDHLTVQAGWDNPTAFNRSKISTSVLLLNLWHIVNHLKSGGYSTYRPVYHNSLRPNPTHCIWVPYGLCSKQRLVLLNGIKLFFMR